MIEAKELALAAAKIARPWPRQVAVDLGDATALTGGLAAGGWRPSEPALFIAELALKYLEPRAAFAVLRLLGTICGPRGRIALTIRFGDVVDDQLAAATAAAGEPMRFRPLRAELSEPARPGRARDSGLARSDARAHRRRGVPALGAVAYVTAGERDHRVKGDPVHESLAQGLDFLRRRQEPTGEFRIQLWTEGERSFARRRPRGHRRRPRALCAAFRRRHPRSPTLLPGRSASCSGRCGLPACGHTGRPPAASGSSPTSTTRRCSRSCSVATTRTSRSGPTSRRSWPRETAMISSIPGSERRIGPTTWTLSSTRTSCLRSGSARRREPLATTFAPACCPARRRAGTGTTSTTPPFTTRFPGRSGTGSARSAVSGTR